MSKFYDKLAALDRGIADRWKARSGDNLKYKIKPKDVMAILDPLKSKGSISEKQVEAINKLMERDCTDEALAVIQIFVKFGVQAGLFQQGGNVLVTPDQLRPITNALGAGMTGKIAFKSPGTNFSYVPGHYQAVQSLVSKSKIGVLEVRLHGLEILGHVDTLGEYQSNMNRLFIFAGRPPAETAMTIVHEVTHAIQDWQDISAKGKYIEADAYIAGAVADIAQGEKATTALAGHRPFSTALAAARLVVAGKANAGGASWTQSYKAVVAEIEQLDGYKKTNEQMFPGPEKGEGTGEKDQMDAILAELAKKAA